MPMDPKKLINQFSWKRSQSAVFSHLHKIHFADIWLVSVYTVTYLNDIIVLGCSFDRHIKTLGSAFQQLCQSGLHLNVVFFPDPGPVLEAHCDGVATDLDKTNKVAEWPVPMCK